ncbi:MAG TPA: hypothetical protein DCM87_15075 [Planctomycetes bacterium]|nr:hypothetical protein [Planctomycetota bacterium]
MAIWPEWWQWQLELSSHLLKRMLDRSFSEIDLRLMMDRARGLRKASEPGRWIVETNHDSMPWEVAVEPDKTDRLVVVITAYPVSEL